MRSVSWFPVSALFALLVLSSCGGEPDAVSPSFATGTCTLTFTHAGGKTLTVQANSINNDAGWFIKNTGTVSATITGQTVSKSGTVVAVRAINWATFPDTLPVGAQVDADLLFDAGASGTGSVGMTISTSCGSKVLPIHPVVIQASPPSAPGGTIGVAPRNGTLWNISGNSHRTRQYSGATTGALGPGPGPNAFTAGSRIEAGTGASLTTWRNNVAGDPAQDAYTISRIGTGDDMSWHGGYVLGSSLEDGSVNWGSPPGGPRDYHDQTAFAWYKGKRGLIEHFSAYNKGDGFELGNGGPDSGLPGSRTDPAILGTRDGLVLRFSAIEGMGDDAVENDLKDEITIYRNYLSGMVILSTRPASADVSKTNDMSSKFVTFDGNICWLRPKRFHDSTPRTLNNVPLNLGDPGVFNFWKWQTDNSGGAALGINVRLQNNILRYDETAQHDIPAAGADWTGNIWGTLTSAKMPSPSNNVVLFPNRASGLPGPGWPASGTGFTYIYGSAAKTRWNQEINAWMAAHPEVKVTDPGLFPGF